MRRSLRYQGLVPAAIVTVVLAAALLATPVGAALRPFLSVAYPCTGVTLSVAPPSPQTSGMTLTFTASGTCPSPSPMYEFWVLEPGSTWTIGQPYSTSATFGGPTTGLAAGTYHFGVWVRDASSSAPYDAYASMPFTLNPAVCGSPGVTAAPPTSTTSGTHVGFTASSSGCPAPVYEFWALWQGAGAWQLLQSYSANPVYNWNSTGALPGMENFGIWVRDASSSAPYDAFTSIPYGIVPFASCTVSDSAVPTSVSFGSGTHATITATSTGCPTPLYEFWMRPSSTLTWQLVQGYSATATYDWDSHGAAPGSVYFGVWVRDATSSAAYDGYNSTFVNVT